MTPVDVVGSMHATLLTVAAIGAGVVYCIVPALVRRLRNQIAAAATNATAKAHRFSAYQTATEPTVLRIHETMALITPGSAAAIFPVSAFSQLARVLSCFLTQSAAPPLPVALVPESNRPRPRSGWSARWSTRCCLISAGTKSEE